MKVNDVIESGRSGCRIRGCLTIFISIRCQGALARMTYMLRF